MKLVAQLKLQPTEEQHEWLKRTLEAANAACNYVSGVAWGHRSFNQFELQKLSYQDARRQFGVGSNIAVRVFAKVADAYKLDKRAKRTFKPHGAFPFNERLVSYKLDKRQVSIWTMGGRQKMTFVAGERQLAMLHGLRSECDLVYRGGEFYLYQTCDVQEEPERLVTEWVGVDMGVANIAVTSDNQFYQSNTVKGMRHRHQRLRATLQRKGTKSAKRRLKALSGKERRFAADVNHCISKRIVQTAQGTGRGIALEDLRGIRDRVTAHRRQRAILHSWAFFQLRAFIEYKGQRAGVPVKAVDPRNTSRTCPACGHVDKANRQSQDRFHCIRCGTAGRADYFAALEIGRRGALNHPHAGSGLGLNPA